MKAFQFVHTEARSVSCLPNLEVYKIKLVDSIASNSYSPKQF